MMPASVVAAVALLVGGCGGKPQPKQAGPIEFLPPPGKPLFNGKDLAGWRVLKDGYFDRAGKVYVKDGCLILEAGSAMTGVAWAGEFPKDGYEVELEARRIDGQDFFCGMTFPAAGSHATLIVGGWGGMVVGISNVDDLAADENETTKIMKFEQNRWYRIRLRVCEGHIEAWIDDEQVVKLPTAKRRFNVWPQQEAARPFGVTTWHTGSAIRDFRLWEFED